ncbi:MAG: uroporphyrinogen decarboxylase family protein [Tepidisphaeraceae bacterium]|jgi:uroporphyrinogen decarboxylase
MSNRSNWSSRERVLAAIAHQQPDRTPRDFWAERPAMNRLFAQVGHRDEEKLLRELGIDLRHLNAIEPAEVCIAGRQYQNFWGERYIYRETAWGPFREDMPGALASAGTLAELEAFPFPTPDRLDYSRLAESCRRHESHALVYGFADVWQRPGLVRGWEQWFMDMVEHPEWVHFMSRKFTDFYRADYTRAAEVSGGRIDVYLLISDLGSQSGPLISLNMFREFVAPYLREMVQVIHGLGARVLYHSCGAIHAFIEELIGLGVDILDPIQPATPEMTPRRLKDAFGGRLAFHGGIDMQQLLPHGTPRQIARTVRDYCQTLGAGGGYILGPAHLFQPDVPPENILAVYAAAP